MNIDTPFAIITGDFVKTGGMDRANFALASYLLRQGNPVHLVAFRADQELLDLPNASFHRTAKPWNSYAVGLSLLRVQGRNVAKQVNALGGRVVVNGGNCRWDDVNWVHYVHAAWTPTPSGSLPRRWKSRYFHRSESKAERRALRSSRVVIANSERTRSILLDRLDLPPERVRTVYYGTDPEVFHPASPEEKADLRREFGWDDRPCLAFVGALGDARKGFDTLFNALKILVKDPSWDARLIVVGTGSTLEYWKQRSKDEGISDEIAFLGFRSDVPKILKACDGLVSPTRYEAYGLNVHEAICSGLPAIVSADAGVAERYPSELRDSLIADPEDPAEVASRLRRWREGLNSGVNDAEIRAFSEKLRSGTWDAMAAKFLSSIDDLS